MGKKITLGTAIALVIIAVAITFSLTMATSLRGFNTKVSSITEREKMYSKFTEVDDYVRQYHKGDIDEQLLMDSVAGGYLKGIDDPYAAYMSADAYKAYLDSQSGSKAGIGVAVTQDGSGYMIVNKVFIASTAETAGIQKGDLIVKVDDIKVTSETFDEASSLLFGEAGTKVTVTVRRENEDTEMEITRRLISEDTLSVTKIGNSTYIHIDAFNDNTPDQFSKVVDTAVSDGSSAIIFDVRNTGGSDMKSAAAMLDKLLAICDMLYVEYSDGNQEVLYSSNARKTDMPMIVIANEQTSEAGEFFAGCLRDYGRAKIVGYRTAGVGSMQEVFMLEDGSAIKLTTGKYYLAASGYAWEGVGMTPDFTVTLDYSPDFSDVTLLDPTLDSQLSKAIEVLSSTIAANEASAE